MIGWAVERDEVAFLYFRFLYRKLNIQQCSNDESEKVRGKLYSAKQCYQTIKRRQEKCVQCPGTTHKVGIRPSWMARSSGASVDLAG